jgi:transcriptional regulator with XRE-family HTH domain
LTLANRIREFRNARGMTLNEVAEAVGASNQQISHLENGRRRLSIPWLQKLSEVFGCDPLDLISSDLRTQNIQEKQLLEAYRQLDPIDQQKLLKHAKDAASNHLRYKKQ